MTIGCRDDLVPRESLGGAVVAIVGTFSDSASEAIQISDSGHSNIANLPTRAESPCGPLPALRTVPQQGRGRGGRGQ